ncbi:hypothetical protein AOC36_02470 [Erysipelothrix larvae]|uniref:SsuA/THI5-like domain-containing protein n=1 Tax=Erysipelothrix larvae TaxID=1514105 RepID=A0A0X8GYS1_9FIRM|nr:ABC transporter substrate-binding protein [Erysipelothrix larvae]AMC92886.1 hypothetical protein AOC36_02470 [Erysipelothrix larvae]
MKKIGLLLVSLCAILAGCSSSGEKPLEKITIGVMPSLDSVPVIWAEKQGYFEELGLEVELIVYSNGNDRDTQVQTKAVDAVVTDIMGLVAMREAGYDVVGLSSTQTIFSMVTKEENLTKDVISVGMAEVSVTQYAADLGLTDFTIKKEFIDAVPQRLEMVAKGLLDGAILPEPMASMSVVNGLDRIVLEFDSPNLLMWQQSSVDSKSASITKFYEAYNKAVGTLKDDESALKDAVIEKLGLDTQIKDSMVFPTYTEASELSETVYDSVVSWMKSTLDMDTDVKFEDAVNTNWVK